MRRSRRTIAVRIRITGLFAGTLLSLCSSRSVAETRSELWPGLDAYFRLDTRTRALLAAQFTHAEEPEEAFGGGIYRDVQLRASIDVSLKPILRRELRKADWERARYLWARLGYQYGTSVGDVAEPYREHRGIVELTARFPFAADYAAANRIHLDLRDVGGVFSTRVRDRVVVERQTVLFGVAVVPWLGAELHWDSRFDAWNREAYEAGLEIALGDAWRIGPSFTRQEDHRSEPAQVNAFGLTLKYYR